MQNSVRDDVGPWLLKLLDMTVAAASSDRWAHLPRRCERCAAFHSELDYADIGMSGRRTACAGGFQSWRYARYEVGDRAVDDETDEIGVVVHAAETVFLCPCVRYTVDDYRVRHLAGNCALLDDPG